MMLIEADIRLYNRGTSATIKLTDVPAKFLKVVTDNCISEIAFDLENMLCYNVFGDDSMKWNMEPKVVGDGIFLSFGVDCKINGSIMEMLDCMEYFFGDVDMEAYVDGHNAVYIEDSDTGEITEEHCENGEYIGDPNKYYVVVLENLSFTFKNKKHWDMGKAHVRREQIRMHHGESESEYDAWVKGGEDDEDDLANKSRLADAKMSYHT